MIDAVPLADNRQGTGLQWLDGPPADPAASTNANVAWITEGYFEAMGIPLLAGRALTARDNAQSQPVVVINRRLARQVFGDLDPIGRRVRVGNATQLGFEVIAVVGKKDAFYLQLSVDELDVQRVQEGQEVLVKIDAYPGKIFGARLTKIYPMVDRRQQAVRADAELNENLPGWFSGLALEANIIIRKKDQAVVIPKSKLLPGDSVIIQSDEGSKKVKVTKGIETLDEVEIVSGL